MKEKTPDVSELGVKRSPKDRNLFPDIEDPLSFVEFVATDDRPLLAVLTRSQEAN